MFDFYKALEHRLQSTDTMLALVVSGDREPCIDIALLLEAYILKNQEQIAESTMLFVYKNTYY